jgi:hypothetical protein
MKFLTTDKTDLMLIQSVAPHPDGLKISGIIMGAMPMTAILTPSELRRSFKLVNLRIVFAVLGMLFRR